MKCPHCEAEIRKDSIFCKSCGKMVALPAKPSPGKGADAAPKSPLDGIVKTVIVDDHESEAPVIPALNEESVRYAFRGKYDIIHTLGSDTFGTHYEAKERSLTSRRVFLNVFPAEISGDPEKKALFEREIRIIAGMTHPNIADFFSAGAADGYLYYATRYVEGKKLDLVLKSENMMSTADVVRVGEELCDVLHYAHGMSIFHGNLNPGSMLVDGRGNIRVTDFGIAALKEVVGAANSAGFQAYLAPERSSGSPADERSDMYSLGVLLYEMLAGKKPFGERSVMEGEKPGPLRSFRKELPEGLEALVNRLLEWDPDRRGSIEKALTALRSFSRKELAGLKKAERSIYGVNESFEGRVYPSGEIIPAVLWFMAAGFITAGIAFLFRFMGVSWFTTLPGDVSGNMIDTGLFIGAFLAIFSGGVLWYTRRDRLTSAAVAVYWCGLALSLQIITRVASGQFEGAISGLKFSDFGLIITSVFVILVSVFILFRLRSVIDAVTILILSALICFGGYLILDAVRSSMVDWNSTIGNQTALLIGIVVIWAVFILFLMALSVYVARRKIDFLYCSWPGTGNALKYSLCFIMMLLLGTEMYFLDSMRLISRSFALYANVAGDIPLEIDIRKGKFPAGSFMQHNPIVVLQDRKFVIDSTAWAGFDLDVSECTGKIRRNFRLRGYDREGKPVNNLKIIPEYLNLTLQLKHKTADFSEGFINNNAGWEINNFGRRRAFSEIDSGYLYVSCFLTGKYMKAKLKKRHFRDFTAIFDVHGKLSDGLLGFYFRSSGVGNGYFFMIKVKQKVCGIFKSRRDVRKALYSDFEDSINSTGVNTIKIHCVSNVIRVYANSSLLAAVSDGDIGGFGYIGFSAQEGGGAFSNLKIYSYD